MYTRLPLVAEISRTLTVSFWRHVEYAMEMSSELQDLLTILEI